MITKKCKQCGREFTLTDGEIEFFRSKGLNIPARCESCRKANKSGKSGKTAADGKESLPVKKGSGRTVYAAVVLIAVIIAAAVFGKVLPGSSGGNNTYLQASETTAASHSESTVKQTAETAAVIVSETSVTSAKDTYSQASETTAASYSESTIKQTAVTVSETSVTSAAENLPVYRFRNDKLLLSHYEKHGIEMGFASAEEYEKAASAVVVSPDALHKTEKEDGDDVYYIESTNEFVIVSTDGFIRTYFYPDKGKDYFDKQ